MRLIKEIWSLPNTILSWLLLQCVSGKNILYYHKGLTVVKKGGFIQSVTLGIYAISTEANKDHERKHIEISKLLGWGYLIHIYYLIYSIVLVFMFNNSVTSYNLIGAVLFFGLWFWFNEYLAKKGE